MAGNLSPKLPWELANPKWAQSINPLLSNPLCNGLILPNVPLATGATTISHRLGRALQGYLVILNNTQCDIWDSQATNQRPDLTLILNSSADTTVSIYVF